MSTLPNRHNIKGNKKEKNKKEKNKREIFKLNYHKLQKTFSCLTTRYDKKCNAKVVQLLEKVSKGG